MLCAWCIHARMVRITCMGSAWWSQGSTIQGFEPESECDLGSNDLAAATSVLRVLRVVKLLRLLRLARLFRLLERWREAIGLSHNLQRLSKLMFLMLLFSHWDGCLLFLLAYLEGFPDNSWVVRAGALHNRDSLLDMTGFEQVSE